MRISDWSSDVCSSDLASCRCKGQHCAALQDRRARIGFLRDVLNLAEMVLGKLLLAPLRPEFSRGSGGAIAAVSHANRQQQMGIGEQVRDFLLPLVADRLAYEIGRASCRERVCPYV